MARGLIDTNVVICLDRVRADELPDEPVISMVTLAELSAGPLTTSDLVEQATRQSRVQGAEASFAPIPFGAPAARAFGLVSAGLRRVGRKATARSYDALIAATALAEGLPLYTMNPDDFRGIDGLDVRAVTHPGG
jgi:predicted nucleic acid-binding protein